MSGNVCFSPRCIGEPVKVTLSNTTGVEPTYTLPAGYIYRLLGLACFFQADATGILGRVHLLEISWTAGAVITRVGATVTVAVSGAARYSWALGNRANIGTGTKQLSTPDVILPAGAVIRLQTYMDTIGAGDTFTQIRLTLQRWRD